MNRIKRAFYAMLVLCFAMTSLPALATDRVIWYYGQNPPSSWHNQVQRDLRLGDGQYRFDGLQGAGLFGNLCTVPGGGLTVSVGPCTANSQASLYQYLPEELTPYGGPGGTALAADNTQVELQGLMNNSQAQTIGPLNPPAHTLWSIIYVIECKVQTLDQTAQSVNFVSPTGSVTTSSANRDRADTIFCQSVAGSPAATPTAPAVDAGYVGTSQVTVPNGLTTILTGNIVTTTANGFYGFARLNAGGGINASSIVPQTTAQATFGGSVNYTFTQTIFTGAAANGYGDAYYFGSQTSSGYTAFGSNSGAVQGTTGSLFSIGDRSVAPLVTGDTSGDIGAKGYVYAHGNLRTDGVVQVGTAGTFVTPVYTQTGGAVASTQHGVFITVTVPASGTTCGPYTTQLCVSVSLGSAAFTSSTSFNCAGESHADLVNSGYFFGGSLPSAAWNSGSTIIVGPQLSTGSGYAGKTMTVYCQGT